MHLKKNIMIFLMFLLTLAGLSARDIGKDEKMAFAHDTPWFRPEDYSLYADWFYNYPLLSVPEELEKNVNSLHVESKQMCEIGIDGLFLDFGAQEGNKQPCTWHWMLPIYLKAAEGTGLQVSFCLDVGASAEYWAGEIIRLVKENGNHPNFPRYEGKYVIATYVYLSMKADTWHDIREIVRKAGYELYIIGNVAPLPGAELNLQQLQEYNDKDAYDALYLFDSPCHAKAPPMENAKIMTEFCKKINKRFVPCLHPGYYGEWRISNPFYNPYRGLDFLYDTFKAAQTCNAKWFHVTTWNDLLETAILERAYTFGIAHTVNYYLRTLKGKEPIAGKPDIVLAYHREELPGTMLRIEAMNLPCSMKKPVEIKGRLLDWKGKTVFNLPSHSFEPGKLDRTEWLVPTETLAYTPHLTPEFVITCGKEYRQVIQAPSVHFVSSWIQNAVTVNMPANRLMKKFPYTLEISQKEDILRTKLSFESPEEIRRITLLRNDHPIGIFSPAVNADDIQLCISLAGVPSDIDITVENGKVLRAVKKGQVKNHPTCRTFDFTEKTVYTANSLFGNHGITFAGKPDMSFTVADRKGNTEKFDAKTICRQKIQQGKLAMFEYGEDLTMRNDKPLKMSSGEITLNLFSRPAFHADRFSLRFETVSGKVLLTAPVYPFGDKEKPLDVNILATNRGLERRMQCYPTQNEFLTPRPQLPVQAPHAIRAQLSPMVDRECRWDFDANNCDRVDCSSMNVQPEFLVDGGINPKGKALTFNGNTSIKLPNRRWPIGGFGRISFYLNPAPTEHRGPQCIVHCYADDGLSINLTSDGKLEVIRFFKPGDSFNDPVKEESVVSRNPLKISAWNHVEIIGDAANIKIYVNGMHEGTLNLTPSRSFGGSQVVNLGYGYPKRHPFKGQLDELVISGLPVREKK